MNDFYYCLLFSLHWAAFSRLSASFLDRFIAFCSALLSVFPPA